MVSLVLGATIIYVGLCLILFLTQRSQIYWPTPEVTADAEALRIASGDASLKIWVVRRAGPNALIYFGGNAEDVAANLPDFKQAFPDHSLFLANYRGYGGSSGRASEAALFADALALFDVVREQHPHVAVVGRSLGSGVATWLASERDVEKLVLITPFDSLAAVAQGYFRVFPVRLLMRDKFDSAGRASRIRAPTLIVVAADDEVIPRVRSDALVAAFTTQPVTVEVIAGAGHNSLDLFPRYLNSMQQFLQAGGPQSRSPPAS
jgi:hypothetical protein